LIAVTKADLRIDWATHEAAKYACENWHYSKSLPVGKMVKIGAWEGGRFIGVVIFAWGMNRNLGSPYGLGISECCELVRVALTRHKTQVSRIVKIALAFLKSKSPGLKMIVSFADPEQGHSGGIYQAGNWVYAGRSPGGFEWVLNGKRLNKRAFTGQQFGGGSASVAKVPKGAVKRKICGKHRYLMPLDDAMRKQIQSLAKPYPKCVTSAGSGTLGNPAEKGRCDSDRNAFESP
jgi:hypothetical protein